MVPVGGDPVARFLSPTTAPPKGQATREGSLAPVATMGGAAPPGPRTLLTSSAIRGIEASPDPANDLPAPGNRRRPLLLVAAHLRRLGAAVARRTPQGTAPVDHEGLAGDVARPT